jgi:hypothetical protein
MKRRIIIAAIVAVLIVPALSAQILPIPDLLDINGTESNTSRVTQGLFGTDVDDVQDVNNYSNVEFTRAFAFANAGTIGGVGGGYATRLGNLFLGVTYNGNLWDGNDTYTKHDGDPSDTANFTWGAPDITFNNRLDVLIGSESFGGIKLLVFFEDFGRRTNKNEVTPTNSKEVSSTGSIYLAGVWGKNFTLGEGTLKPEFGLAVQFDVDGNEKYSVGSTSATYKAGYTSIALRAAADYEFAPQGNVATTLSGDYTFVLNLKPSPAYEAKNYAIVSGDPLSGYGLTGTLESVELSDKGAYIMNRLNASYSKRYEINERWSAAWKAGAGLGFDFEEEKYSGSYRIGGSTTNVDDDGTATTTFSIEPTAAAAFKYKFASKPFSLNAGVALDTGFAVRKENDKANKDITTTYDFDDLTATFGLGGTLNPMENFTIDMYLNNALGSNFNFTFNANNISIGLMLSLKM